MSEPARPSETQSDRSAEVLCRIDGRVATIVLNRPEARNAVNPALAAAMTAVMADLERRPEVWVVILTGSGNLAFSAGADLKAIAAGTGHGIHTETGGFGGFVHYPRTKPVIAAVNGLALAGGCELVLACDIVVASKKAEFGLPEVKRGIVASGGALFRLPTRIPRGRAIELILTGDRLSADEAFELGLVDHVVEPGEEIRVAQEIAERICANAPIAVRESLAIARRAANLSEADGWAASAAARERVLSTSDGIEGPRAFAEKRPPVWRGE